MAIMKPPTKPSIVKAPMYKPPLPLFMAFKQSTAETRALTTVKERR